jgi:hypothetical protein
LKAVSPAGPAGAVDVKVTSPGGTSATGSADRFTYFSAPAVSGVSPSSGPVAGGTSVTITGSGFTFAMAVNFGTSAATSFVVNSDSQITAVSPAGAAGTVDVLVSSSAGTSAAAASDRFTYQAPVSTPQPAPGSTPAPGAPSSGAGAPPASLGSTSEVFAGVVNPQGLPTIAYFQYGLDSTYQPHVAAVSYNQQTPPQQVGSDFTNHTVTATVTGLVPHALYHYRLVSSNSAGTAFGPDATFTTAQDPPPPPPIEGKTTNLAPVAGLVLIELPHTHHFVPLTEAIQIPFGSTVNATAGTVALTAARTPNLHGPLQTADFYDGEFFVTQRRGNALTYLKLVGGLSCSKRAPEPRATAAGAPPHKLKRKLWGNGHGQFQTQGSYASASVQGTFWLTEDFCDGTLVQVRRGVVKVLAFRTKKTVLVPAGHSYFAKSR